ncbi:hypothetical protein [Brevibacillus sp. SYSU BS000544]|uniref:hypothetical protein n=1 Tax=Brevibacillus sp. SYSU BS000544 TaxID=3416443 RepID=UPI003CE44863
MFYHGINREYVYQQYPVLSPRRTVSHKNREQRSDRRHLIDQFGIEPIHLLQSSDDYPKATCIEECMEFGDLVLEFTALPDPVWQLSKHEVGVFVLDVRQAHTVYCASFDDILTSYFPSSLIQISPCHCQIPTL